MTEIEERIFGGEWRGGCLPNRALKMKEYLLFCREVSVLCIEDRVVVEGVA